MNSHEFEF